MLAAGPHTRFSWPPPWNPEEIPDSNLGLRAVIPPKMKAALQPGNAQNDFGAAKLYRQLHRDFVLVQTSDVYGMTVEYLHARRFNDNPEDGSLGNRDHD